MNDHEHDIDQLLGESLRRRGASAQLGGGTIADVHRRVTRRRRRLVAGLATAIAVPALIGVVALAGSRDDSGRVASPATAADGGGATDSTVPVPAPDVVHCIVDPTAVSMVTAPDVVVTSGELCIVPGMDPTTGAVQVAAPVEPGGWRCLGEPDTSKPDDGWTYYTTCEPVCPVIDVAPATTVVIDPAPSTTVAIDGDVAGTTTTIVSDATSTVPLLTVPATTIVVSPPGTTIVDVLPVPTVVVTPANGPFTDVVSACSISWYFGDPVPTTTIAG